MRRGQSDAILSHQLGSKEINSTVHTRRDATGRNPLMPLELAPVPNFITRRRLALPAFASRGTHFQGSPPDADVT